MKRGEERKRVPSHHADAAAAPVPKFQPGANEAAARWLERFRWQPPPVESRGVCQGTVGALPVFTVQPDATGTRLVRVSLPFAPASYPAGLGLTARACGREVPTDVRVLTRHPGQPPSVRRAMITFPFPFASQDPVTFALALADAASGDSGIDADVAGGTAAGRGMAAAAAVEAGADAGEPPTNAGEPGAGAGAAGSVGAAQIAAAAGATGSAAATGPAGAAAATGPAGATEPTGPAKAKAGAAEPAGPATATGSAPAAAALPSPPKIHRLGFCGLDIELSAAGVAVRAPDGPGWEATLLAPEQAEPGAVWFETVESGAHYLWVRLLSPDAAWPRIIELRANSQGTVILQAHVQRLAAGDAYAPDLGWRVTGLDLEAGVRHSFDTGQPCTLRTADRRLSLSFPVAPLTLKGGVEVVSVNESALGAAVDETLAGEDAGALAAKVGGATDDGTMASVVDTDAGPVATPDDHQPAAADAGTVTTYWRCRCGDRVPFQSSAWRRAALAVGPAGHPPVNALLEPDLEISIRPEHYDAVYTMGLVPDLADHPLLDDALIFHWQAVTASALRGDDYGNVTSFQPGAPAPYYGMNRLNHGPAIFHEAWRASGAALRQTAVLWCSNMHDLSLWWADAPDFGGTRYNAAVAAGEKEHEGDTSFLWRTNRASHFCTKGYDTFFYAYEETGDPRMLAALRAQVEYARTTIHTNTGECRNIGDAADFMRLYRCTGVPMYRDEALRLFRELTDKLSTGDLFDQGGKPLTPHPPFIDDDEDGYTVGYAKPYIIGYALAGLPDLLRVCPDEPRLRDVVRAVADFLAASQDPAGGWRYPHPRSSHLNLGQGLEHAVQLSRAAAVLQERGETVGELLNAIERVLQCRIHGWCRSGQVLNSLGGWEQAAGAIPEGKTIYDLYAYAVDRDPGRDYAEGRIGVGGAPPEGLVYWGEVLSYYLSRRPAERLFHAGAELCAVLARMDDARVRLTPEAAGAYLRLARPDHPQAACTLWAPEWVSFPPLGYGEDELGGMDIDWRRDEHTGALAYTLERPEATFTAQFTPHIDYVECAYTVWPHPDAEAPAGFTVGPCLQLQRSVFPGEADELMARMWFLSGGTWTCLAACAGCHPRNVQFVQGADSPEMDGAMAAGGWRTIHDPRPDVPLLACVSADGAWIAATATEGAHSICHNAAASHRCMHAQGPVPLNPHGPTTQRAVVYLMQGSLEQLRVRYAADRSRWNRSEPVAPCQVERTATFGMRQDLPAFNAARVRRLHFPLAWKNAQGSFAVWRQQARDAYLRCLQSPPPQGPCAAQVLAREDRGSYVACKLALNITGDERVKAYLLIPRGQGPFPAVLALHDHGAHFSIGKEKVVRPFGEPESVLADAADWVGQCYGGRHIGDELARRGYVVLAMDALFWGERGRWEGVQYEAQQALAANLLQLGQSWAGTIVWDDLRGAEFLQSLPEVDPERIAAMGLSVGAHRTWSLAAATDIIKAGAAICWMGDTQTLAAPGNNQTRGFSSFSMIHPGIRAMLDYADVASIACPKPMLFYNGIQDGLFPVAGVETAYAKMRQVWASQGAADRLVTRLWPAPHEFNADMQAEAIAWLDGWLQPGD